MRPRSPPYKINEYLAIGPCRGAGGPTIRSLAREGFKHVIDLNADTSEKSLSKAVRACYHPIKIIDRYGEEDWRKKMQEAVHVIDQAVRAREKVYLHCTYGRGRSATVAMAYLISKDWSVNEAIEHVKAEGRLVWCEGNPVSKYERILRLYSYSISRRRAREK